MKRRRPLARRHSRALSSVYGFIMIYLLVIASLQAISSSLSSGQNAEVAAQEAAQVSQTRSLEHLQVRLGTNVTVTNDGLISSYISVLLVKTQNGSRELPFHQEVPVGGKVSFPLGSAASVAVVTTLGNVFASSQASSSSSSGSSTTLLGAIGGPGVDGQIYMNPADPTRFFLADGSSVTAFSVSNRSQLWTFDAGQGVVTDVLPLSDGGVYLSDGYFGDQYTSDLFALSSSGTTLDSYSMRLLRLYTTIEVQFPNNGQPPYPVGSQPVQKGLGSLYAFYDGWFFSSKGPSPTTVPSDSVDFATSDSAQFYLYQPAANPGGFGCSYPRGNAVTFLAYSAASQGVTNAWSTTVYLNFCNLYPDDLLASTAGSGLTAYLFSDNWWSQPNYYGGPYQGTDPYLVVLSSSSGSVERSGILDSSGYTSVATDGTNVYLSIPSSHEVEVLSASGAGAGTFYDVGIPASTLLWADGSLFAISKSQVKVYDSAMTLLKAIDFSPQSFYSLSTTKPLEPQMLQPSFLVLNSTSYAALVRNSTGYGSLLIGDY
jgi:hypothetical protein